jgi:hypothetical protein
VNDGKGGLEAGVPVTHKALRPGPGGGRKQMERKDKM